MGSAGSCLQLPICEAAPTANPNGCPPARRPCCPPACRSKGLPDNQPLPPHLSDVLAKAIRGALSRRRTGASAGAGEVDLSEMEGRFMATSGPLAAQLVTEDYEERLTMLSAAVCTGG